MIIVAFIIYALHYFFIIHWVAGAARWSANTLADMGYNMPLIMQAWDG
jgi:hypothetical protein